MRQLYLFYGEETYLRRKLVDTIKQQVLSGGAQDFNYDYFDGREVSASQIVAAAETLPVMAPKRLVVTGDAMFFSSQAKYRLNKGDENQLIEYFKAPNPSTVVVFYLKAKPDGKKNIVKVISRQGLVMEMGKLYGDNLAEWLKDMFTQQGKEIERSGLTQLLTVGSDLAVLEKEVEKLVVYAGDAGRVTRNMVEECMSRTAESDVFKMVDAIGAQRSEDAVQYLREILLVGEPPIRVLLMISRQFQLLLSIKVLLDQGYSSKQTAGKLRLPQWLLAKLVKQSRNFTVEQLENAIMAAAKLDRQIKRSTINSGRAMEILILSFSG